MKEDELFMSRCIQLAKNGKAHARPNPMVGAVIVHEGTIIGEGYHIKCGGPHAEVNAIKSVKMQELLKDSTIYVSLEPCSHYGKTPPCADLIIEKQIPRIVIGCQDPFSKVAGRGIQKLREAGREVKVGILENECIALNKCFIKYNTNHRPFISLKWAQSADGFIDKCRTSGQPVILSSPLSQMRVHKIRTENTAILIGRRTAILDNPSLTSRLWYGDNPIRCIIDKGGILPTGLHLFDQIVPTFIYTDTDHKDQENITYIKLDFSQDIIPQILAHLNTLKIQSLLVEGGAQTLQSFIDDGLWDEAHVETVNISLKEGVQAPHLHQKDRKECQISKECTIELYVNKN